MTQPVTLGMLLTELRALRHELDEFRTYVQRAVPAMLGDVDKKIDGVCSHIDDSANRVMKNSASLANELIKQGKKIEEIASVFAEGHDDVRDAHASMSIKFRKLLANGHVDDNGG